MHKKIILHDLDVEYQDKIKFDDAEIINAKKPYAKCKGCFVCWLKTPSKCVLKDGMENLGSKVLSSDEIVVISKILYGGLSIEIKRLWDRCIPGILPFFTTREGKLHHRQRFNKHPKMRFHLYNADECSEKELQLVKKVVKANGINYMSNDCKVMLYNNIDELLEVNI